MSDVVQSTLNEKWVPRLEFDAKTIEAVPQGELANFIRQAFIDSLAFDLIVHDIYETVKKSLQKGRPLLANRLVVQVRIPEFEKVEGPPYWIGEKESV